MKKKLYYNCIKWCFITACVMNANNGKAQANYDIYLFDVKAGTTKQLTHTASGGEWNASWSNNSKKIAHDYSAPSGQAIYITDIETGVSTPLAGGETGNDPAWSPGGEKIAFDDWEDYYQIGWWTQNIYMVSADGGARSLFRFGAHHASWNPRGNKIAFDDNNGYITTKDINTGLETFVTYYGDKPSWSPNGQYIAFNGAWWLGGGVWIVEVDTLGYPQGWPIQLTASGYGPTWKNNSKEIVFVDGPNGDPDLYSIPVTGGASTRICGRVGGFDQGDYDASYSSNGQFIAWSGYTEEVTLTKSNTSSEKITDLNTIAFNAVIYPNPARGVARLEIKGNVKNISVTITNINGQMLWQSKYTNQSQINLPVEKLTAGVYIVSVKTGTESKTLKLVKE